MKRICGGEKCKVVFVPGVAWCEMASVWPTSDYAREVQPIQYAADVDWMSPWGPYAIWPTQQPYVYSKWRNLRTFVAARDVRAQVDLDYPLPKRPKLIAYPHGIQQPDWMIRPEALEMNIDSFFFNGWEALLVYHFPQGYDQRWWFALARCAEKQAKYEDVVFDGRRADGDVALELTTPFAAPNSCEGTATHGLDGRAAEVICLRPSLRNGAVGRRRRLRRVGRSEGHGDDARAVPEARRPRVRRRMRRIPHDADGR